MEKVCLWFNRLKSFHVFQMIENSPEMFSRKKTPKTIRIVFFSLGFTHENIMSPQLLKKKKKKNKKICSFSWNVFIRKHMKKNLLKLSKKKICRDFCVVFSRFPLISFKKKNYTEIFFCFVILFWNVLFFLTWFHTENDSTESFSLGIILQKKKFLFHLKKHYLDFFPPQKRENVEHL